MRKYKLLFMALLAFLLSLGQAYALEGRRIFVGSMYDSSINAAPRFAYVTLQIAGPNVLQDLRYSSCREEDLTLWHSCQDQSSEYGQAYFYKQRVPTAEERKKFGLTEKSAALDLYKAYNAENAAAALYLLDPETASAGAVFTIENPIKPRSEFRIELNALQK